MITIKILGTGCHNCLELERRLAEVIAESGRNDVEVQRVDDEHIIRRYLPLDAIPGLLINERLVSEQQVPDRKTLLDWLNSVLV